MAVKVKGLKEVQRNLDSFFEQVEKEKTERAVYQVLSTGMAISQTKAPIDIGELTDSAYAPIFFKRKGKTVGVVGYRAPYALFVHEMSGKLKGKPRAHFGVTRVGKEFGGGSGKGTYWSPDAEPKFLENAFNEIKPEVIRIIQEAYRV